MHAVALAAMGYPLCFDSCFRGSAGTSQNDEHCDPRRWVLRKTHIFLLAYLLGIVCYHLRNCSRAIWWDFCAVHVVTTLGSLSNKLPMDVDELEQLFHFTCALSRPTFLPLFGGAAHVCTLASQSNTLRYAIANWLLATFVGLGTSSRDPIVLQRPQNGGQTCPDNLARQTVSCDMGPACPQGGHFTEDSRHCKEFALMMNASKNPCAQ